VVAQVRSLPARAGSLLGESTSGGGSAAPPHSGGLAAARVVGRTSRGAVGGLVALGGLAGQLERRLERSLSGPMLAIAGGVRAMVRAGERVVTPSRAVGVVVLAAAIALGASQFIDYRGVEIGGQLYEGLESIAPPPQADRATAFEALSVGIMAGSFIAVLILFCVPITLLGTISPFAIRLSVDDLRSDLAIHLALVAHEGCAGILG
jgi:hypothetical protein